MLIFFFLGFGSGANKWIIFFNGGAWCYDEQACYQRSKTKLGSTSLGDAQFPESGLYSNDPKMNPHFHNWNMAFVAYCDGSSLTGMRKLPVYFNDQPVYFRGKAVLNAIIKDLISTRGVRNASDVLLSGSSAGSLAVLIHADFIKAQLNPQTKVRALSDSGYFIDLETHYGTKKTREMYKSMLSTHNSTSGLHRACVKQMATADHWKCLFPQYFFDLIETPVFVLQSAYDIWQIVNNLDVVCTIPSYEDILLFRSLKRLSSLGSTRESITSLRNTPRGEAYTSREATPATRGTNQKSRETNHATRGSNHAPKLSSITDKNGQWRTGIPRKIHGTTFAKAAPRGSHVNSNASPVHLQLDNRDGVQSTDLNSPEYQRIQVWRSPTLGNSPVSNTRFAGPVNEVRHANIPGNIQSRAPNLESQYPTFQRTNAQSLPLQSTPFWRSPKWQNSAEPVSGSRDYTPISNGINEIGSRNRFYIQAYSAPDRPQTPNQQIPDVTQTIDRIPQPRTYYLRSLSNSNDELFEQNEKQRMYSVRKADSEHFVQKRESTDGIQFRSPRTQKNLRLNGLQFKRTRKYENREKTQKVQSKARSEKVWHWQGLYHRPTSCTKNETEKILNLRNITLEALKPVLIKPNSGLFLSPCIEHSQANYASIWQKTKANGKVIRDAISEWYFDEPGSHIHIGAEFDFESCTS